MKQESDPGTAKFTEALIFGGTLVLVHLGAFFVARSSMDLVSRGYLVFCCLVLPMASVAGSFALRSVRGWHWSQVAFVTLLSFFLGFIQLLIVSSAAASV